MASEVSSGTTTNQGGEDDKIDPWDLPGKAKMGWRKYGQKKKKTMAVCVPPPRGRLLLEHWNRWISVADHRWDEQDQCESDKYKDRPLWLQNLELLGKEGVVRMSEMKNIFVISSAGNGGSSSEGISATLTGGNNHHRKVKQLETRHKLIQMMSPDFDIFGDTSDCLNKYVLPMSIVGMLSTNKKSSGTSTANPPPGEKGFVLHSADAKDNHVRKNIFVISSAGNGGSSSEGISATLTGGNNHQREIDSAYNVMPEVLFDTQAHVHCTGNFNVLSNLKIGPENISLVAANNEEMETFMSGSVHQANFELTDVYYCPLLGNRVIVSGSILDNEEYGYEFGWGKFTVTDLKNGMTVGEGRLVDKNYILEYLKSPKNISLVAANGEEMPTYISGDVPCNKTAWDTRMEIIQGIASALAVIHSCKIQIHQDISTCNKTAWNILLDEITGNQLSSKLLQAAPAHNRPLDAKVSKKPSAKCGIEIKIGSLMTHGRRYLSVHHHPLIQMLPSARKWSGDIFTSCARLITSNRIFGMAETGWISAKPEYETPNAGPVSKYIIRKLFGIRNRFTVNESQQYSDPDSCRSHQVKMAVDTKTSASWIVATAAPHHATGDRNLLSGFIMEHDDLFVHAVNRVPMKVLARGAVVTDALILPDVWFVPGLTENLVSVSQLAELDHSVGFGRGECCISARDAKILGKGRLQKGGHYVLDFLKVPLAI